MASGIRSILVCAAFATSASVPRMEGKLKFWHSLSPDCLTPPKGSTGMAPLEVGTGTLSPELLVGSAEFWAV